MHDSQTFASLNSRLEAYDEEEVPSTTENGSGQIIEPRRDWPEAATTGVPCS